MRRSLRSPEVLFFVELRMRTIMFGENLVLTLRTPMRVGRRYERVNGINDRPLNS